MSVIISSTIKSNIVQADGRLSIVEVHVSRAGEEITRSYKAPADTGMVGTDNIERHRAVFKWTYDSGNKTGDFIINMRIRNMIKTTS